MAARYRLHGADGRPDRLLLEPVAAGVADPLARHAAKAEARRASRPATFSRPSSKVSCSLVPRFQEQLAIVHGQQAVRRRASEVVPDPGRTAGGHGRRIGLARCVMVRILVAANVAIA